MGSARENPWKDMIAQTKRRVDIQTYHDFFWICDDDGHFGMMIQFGCPLIPEAFVDQVRGISIVIQPAENAMLYLILHDKRDWEIFLALCWDLLDHVASVEEENKVIEILGKRIKRWQRFLSQENQLIMPERIQMGLFAELSCLLELISAIGIRNAITGWVGPDADQKDFSLKNCFLEVKSYISSKGSRVRISSIGQLSDEIKPVYLLCYGLTRLASGTHITDLIKAIYQHISPVDVQISSIFEQRLYDYGFAEGITQGPFFSYNIDSKKVYAVEEGFPRIKESAISEGISAVKYTLELSKCQGFEKMLQL